MAEITGITPQQKNKMRCNIEVDGRFFCGMALQTVMQNRLKTGMTVTREELAAMQLESEKETALNKALTHISATMKTEKEIRDFLKRKGYVDEVICYVTEKMKSYSFLDDTAYAHAYAESAGGKGRGKRLIAARLKAKGVGEETIEAVLEGIDGEREQAGAETVLKKYLRGKPFDEKTRKRAFAYLISKGYDYDTARAALETWKDED